MLSQIVYPSTADAQEKVNDYRQNFMNLFHITSTIEKIVIEHPAIKKIKFYDTDNVLIGSESNLTNLQKGKIVTITRSMSILNVNRTLKYILVTTADNKVHTIYV